MMISVLGGIARIDPRRHRHRRARPVGAVRYDWDLDNLVAPTVGDPRRRRHHPGAVARRPARRPRAPVSQSLGAVLGVLSIGRHRASRCGRTSSQLRQIVRESIPVLTVALVPVGARRHRAAEAAHAPRRPARDPRSAAGVRVDRPARSAASCRAGCRPTSTSARSSPTHGAGPQVRRDTSFLFGLDRADLHLQRGRRLDVVAAWSPATRRPGSDGGSCSCRCWPAPSRCASSSRSATTPPSARGALEVDPDSYGDPDRDRRRPTSSAR